MSILESSDEDFFAETSQRNDESSSFDPPQVKKPKVVSKNIRKQSKNNKTSTIFQKALKDAVILDEANYEESMLLLRDNNQKCVINIKTPSPTSYIIIQEYLVNDVLGLSYSERWRKVNRSAKIGLTNNKANSKINNLLKNLFDELGEKFLSDESRTVKMTKE
ncbi:uncharacterized protein LOC126842175 [Adelges cooleyi]|uniref:uncharacterized protein LOC126842164 n=1 Tax=Adelges cooleyi TaxID=133065 RepID=UPI00217F4FEB|nr:uncharacterized protein LOC126842164 [Adelges cooleyi]XP_050435018.1 uncharacterized protein LOC126842175 [Adelges cooleyi]